MFLMPQIRLLFAGSLTTLLVLFCKVGFINILIASTAISAVFDKPLEAFVIGAICGISEKLLSRTVSEKTKALVNVK